MGHFFIVVAVTLNLAAVALLCYNIIYHGEQLSKTSWLVWTALAVITALGMFESGALSIQMVIVVVSDILILCLAQRQKGSWRVWTKLDLATMVACVPIIVLWQLTQEPRLAIGLCLLAVLVASAPMVRDLYYKPLAQKPLAYALMALSSVAQTCSFGLGPWRIETHAQPVVYALSSFVFVALMLRGRLHFAR